MNFSPESFGKVAVLAGGFSAEREVSLNSGAEVCQALQGAGVDAHLFDPVHEDIFTLKQQGFQVAFNVLHGTFGEDGSVQAILNAQNIPYTGCGVAASALGMDKYRTKLIWQALGLPVPESVVLRADTDWHQVVAQLGLPMFVKPAAEGSSVGVYKVKTAAQLPEVFAKLQHLHGEILAEKMIGGGEYTCAIINQEALPSIKIVPAGEFYDYEAKYERDDTQYLCPSDLSAEDEAQMRRLALAGFAAIGGRGWGRVDFLRDESGQLYLLEINTCPGMTSHSLVPKAAAETGRNFAQLCMEVLHHATVG